MYSCLNKMYSNLNKINRLPMEDCTKNCVNGNADDTGATDLRGLHRFAYALWTGMNTAEQVRN